MNDVDSHGNPYESVFDENDISQHPEEQSLLTSSKEAAEPNDADEALSRIPGSRGGPANDRALLDG